jgi:hypothetical protein
MLKPELLEEYQRRHESFEALGRARGHLAALPRHGTSTSLQSPVPGGGADRHCFVHSLALTPRNVLSKR